MPGFLIFPFMASMQQIKIKLAMTGILYHAMFELSEWLS